MYKSVNINYVIRMLMLILSVVKTFLLNDISTKYFDLICVTKLGNKYNSNRNNSKAK